MNPSTTERNCQVTASVFIGDDGNTMNDTVSADQMSPNPMPSLLSILNGDIISHNDAIPRATNSTTCPYPLPEGQCPLPFHSEEEHKKHLVSILDQALAVLETSDFMDTGASDFPSGSSTFTFELARQ
ncbi:unnamed protein product [Cylindrotheca closterium]|uniref:Uncharacterized protein n=1 Tax=Cylindrotheca closterium TaxID=2856 RepID=A0AAD2FV45_9STRA|nr:unnamed protein product [Cylindrotheca closterium]